MTRAPVVFRIASQGNVGAARFAQIALLGAAVLGALGPVPFARELPDVAWLAAWIAAGAFFLVFVMLRFLPARATLGADGLVISWMGRRREIGYGRIRRFRRFEDEFLRERHGPRFFGLELMLDDGTVLPVMVEQGSGKKADAFERALRAALDVQRGTDARDLALVARDGRTARAWLQHLRAMGAPGAADPRAPAVDPESLWRVVENGAAPAGARVAAAVALTPRLDEEGRARLRIAAATTSRASVRIALERAAGPAGEDELDEVLEAADRADREAG